MTFIAPALCLAVPLVAVLLWVTIPNNTWPPVAVAAAVLAVALMICSILYCRATVWVDANGVVERRLSGRLRHIKGTRIDRILRIDVYGKHSVDTVPHCFAVDAGGRLLLRLRGDFWCEGSMADIASVLGVPETREPHPLTIAELRSTHPELAGWFPRRITT